MKVGKLVSRTAIVLAVILVALVARVLHQTHAFLDVEPVPVEDCEVIGDFTGSEDIEIDYETGIAYVSSFDFRGSSLGEQVNGEIYMFNPGDPIGSLKVATKTRPEILNIHGLSLYNKPEGGKQLYLINHNPEGEKVEVFDLVDGGMLVHKETITGPGLVSPNDLVVVGERQFYFSNDDSTRDLTRRMLHHLFGGVAGDITFFDGSEFQVVYEVDGMANGITTSRDGQQVFAVNMHAMEVYALARQADNSLKLVEKQQLDFPVDNLNLDREGNLWGAGQGSFLDAMLNLLYPERLSASQVVRIKLAQGKMLPAEKIYANLGDQYASSSVVATYGNRFFLGSFVGRGILGCTLPDSK